MLAKTSHLLAVFSLTAALLPVGSRAAETNWLDVESRIQYGYYTEDPRALAGVMELLAPTEAVSAMRRYYAGLANYRLTQLTAARDKSRAKQAAQACVDNLEQARKIRADFADAQALESACQDLLGGLDAWRGPVAASRSGTLIEKARHLGPGNPRVLLLDAIQTFDAPKATQADKDQAAGIFKKAVAGFETERQETEHVPGWGAAEAYVYLAKCHLDRGATLAARDALERALLIAPEFAEARRLMGKITSG